MSDNILTLRPYQQEAIAAIAADLLGGHDRVAAVLPTGAGKTVVFAHIVKLWREAFPRQKVLILAHTDELVTQAARKLKAVSPRLRVGVVQAERHEVWGDAIVASVQSLRAEKRRADLRGVGLVVVDECHHAAARTYQLVLEHMGCFDGRARAVGFTATLVRGDRKTLGETWQKVSFKLDILWMIRQGYLKDVRGVAIRVPDLDLDKVKRKFGGEFQDEALGRALQGSMAPELIAKAYAEHAAGRSGILFLPTVESAMVVAEAVRSVGITCETVHGAMPREERRAVLARAASGQTQVLANCMVLTEGFDLPRMSCAVIARMTRSAGLYQQMVGRVLRPYGDDDALVLDVVGAAERHSLASLVDLSTTVDRMKEGQSLADAATEAELRVEGEGTVEELEPYRGPTVAAEFDPLAHAKTSRRVWLTTEGGVRFLNVGDRYHLFLLPTPGGEDTWSVWWCTRTHSASGPNGGPTEHADLELAQAITWAEQMVDDAVASDPTLRDGDHGDRRASWRRRNASERQLAFARRLGIEVSEFATGGEVSDLIDRRKVSRRIDGAVARITAPTTDPWEGT